LEWRDGSGRRYALNPTKRTDRGPSDKSGEEDPSSAGVESRVLDEERLDAAAVPLNTEHEEEFMELDPDAGGDLDVDIQALAPANAFEPPRAYDR
jgi:hypothetical protein